MRLPQAAVRALVLASIFFAEPGSAGWRSECSIEGLDIEVTQHGYNPPDPAEEVRKCRVAFLSHEELVEVQQTGEDLSFLDYIFTDSLTFAPFAGRRGMVHFLENVSSWKAAENLDGSMQEKSELLSILLPPRDVWTELTASIFEQATAAMPNHIFHDDGRDETYEAAFAPYRFSLIADDGANRIISELLVRSMGYHTIALYNGFVEIGAMFFNGVADFSADPFSLAATLEATEKNNKHLGALWHYQRIIQDQLQYRYNRPFEERLFSQACALCRLRAGGPDRRPRLAFVGIYSARKNFAKRQAVRETWGRVLNLYGLRYRFFLGEASSGTSREEMLVRQEMEEYNDLVFLDVTEGYRMNSRKGLMFLEWIALHSEAEFLLKIDDDVYFRPVPLLEQLQGKPPAQYGWGYWDYISPVPRDPEDFFGQSEESFPFEVFPPYPRGVVRVLSMDVVRLIAEASREGRLNMIYGDDPCIGVHLRQLLFDSVEPLPSLTLDDFDNKAFAMEPSCHPNLWSRITNRTWAIHHVSPEQIVCMWHADVSAGYYVESPEAPEGLVLNTEAFAGSPPDLCGCATDPSFELRSDLDDLKAETDRVLFGDDEDEEEGGAAAP